MLSLFRTQTSRVSLRQFSTSSPVLVKTLYVGNLSWTTKDDDLRAMFEDFGEVTSAKVISDRLSGRSRGFGFVEMTEDGAADTATEELGGKEIEGRALTVNVATPREDRPPRESNYGGERRSFGGNSSRGRYNGDSGGSRGGYSRRSNNDRGDDRNGGYSGGRGDY